MNAILGTLDTIDAVKIDPEDNTVTVLGGRPTEGRNANKLWAVISIDSKGNEGIVATHTPLGNMPMVTLNPNLLPRFMSHAREIARLAKGTGAKIRLFEYTVRELKEEIE